MTYLLSLLMTQSSIKDSNQILCYYINKSNDLQVVRVMTGLECHFKRTIFSKERILFTASPESYLETYLSSDDSKLLSV
jgi:hypothetical protein